MRIQMRIFVLFAAWLCLALAGTGCDNSTVNEPPSTGTAVPSKDSPPPAQSQKEFYEREAKATNPIVKKAAGAKGAAAAKGAEVPK
jgi:hypothetical protein